MKKDLGYKRWGLETYTQKHTGKCTTYGFENSPHWKHRRKYNANAPQ